MGNDTTPEDLIELLQRNPEKFAENKKYGYPVPIDRIISDCDIDLHFKLYEDDDISGECGFRNNRFFIAVNHQEPDYRQRFTLAHELGHIVLHLWQKTGKGSVLITDSKKTMFRSSDWDGKEYEANAFAAKLLMPKDEVLKQIQKIVDERDSYKFRDDQIRQELVNPLAVYFLVSPSAIEFRLKNLKILN
ncbi:MAG: ImmA/IrrE family metallo-endopeptidase [Candidatus Cloacimonetes bacterium]|nr:ImmA/IrrE family metallo-endopeptidase [Candidatus Cloacimonadota bacterium]